MKRLVIVSLLCVSAVGCSTTVKQEKEVYKVQGADACITVDARFTNIDGKTVATFDSKLVACPDAPESKPLTRYHNVKVDGMMLIEGRVVADVSGDYSQEIITDTVTIENDNGSFGDGTASNTTFTYVSDLKFNIEIDKVHEATGTFINEPSSSCVYRYKTNQIELACPTRDDTSMLELEELF